MLWIPQVGRGAGFALVGVAFPQEPGHFPRTVGDQHREEIVPVTQSDLSLIHIYKHDVTVAGELGVLAGVEDEVSAEHHTYTRPEDVEDFVIW